MPAAAAAANRGLSEYQALTHISLPRADGRTDLVTRGNTCKLTEEQARDFMSRTPPIVRPAREANQPLPVLTGRSMFGMQPGAAPAAGIFPDPAGSSGLAIMEELESIGQISGQRGPQPPQQQARQAVLRSPEWADGISLGHGVPTAPAPAQQAGYGQQAYPVQQPVAVTVPAEANAMDIKPGEPRFTG